MRRLLLGLLLIGVSVAANAQLRGRKFVQVQTGMVLSVTLTSAPTSVTVLPADLKYNKACVFNFESDDNAPNFRYPLAIWGGGKAPDSTSYPGLSFTDGCGNNVGFRAALAVNGRGGFNNQEIALPIYKANAITYPEMAAMVRKDWAIENHSFYHDPTTRYSFKYDAGKNVRLLADLIQSNMAAQGTPYVMRTQISPSSWPNFQRVADSASYLAASSQGQRDGYTLYPASGQTFFDVMTLPQTGFFSIGRAFDDVWSAATVAGWKTNIDNLISGSTGGKHLMWRLGTHGPQVPAQFLDFSNYLASNGQDKIWICSLHEFAEYLEVKRFSRITTSLSGNVLTITINQTRLPDVNRFRDLSLLISGATMQGVSVSGADSFSYNTSTGLINLFRKKTTGF